MDFMNYLKQWSELAKNLHLNLYQVHELGIVVSQYYI